MRRGVRWRYILTVRKKGYDIDLELLKRLIKDRAKELFGASVLPHLGLKFIQETGEKLIVRVAHSHFDQILLALALLPPEHAVLTLRASGSLKKLQSS